MRAAALTSFLDKLGKKLFRSAIDVNAVLVKVHERLSPKEVHMGLLRRPILLVQLDNLDVVVCHFY
jgi:hypothetical protein